MNDDVCNCTVCNGGVPDTDDRSRILRLAEHYESCRRRVANPAWTRDHGLPDRSARHSARALNLT